MNTRDTSYRVIPQLVAMWRQSVLLTVGAISLGAERLESSLGGLLKSSERLDRAPRVKVPVRAGKVETRHASRPSAGRTGASRPSASRPVRKVLVAKKAVRVKATRSGAKAAQATAGQVTGVSHVETPVDGQTNA